jgi:hypothetical protein
MNVYSATIIVQLAQIALVTVIPVFLLVLLLHSTRQEDAHQFVKQNSSLIKLTIFVGTVVRTVITV